MTPSAKTKHRTRITLLQALLDLALVLGLIIAFCCILLEEIYEVPPKR